MSDVRKTTIARSLNISKNPTENLLYRGYDDAIVRGDFGEPVEGARGRGRGAVADLVEE